MNNKLSNILILKHLIKYLIKIIKKFLWKGLQENNNTAIFVVTPRYFCKNDEVLGPNSDGETTEVNLHSVNDIKKAIKGKLSWKVRSFEKKSISSIFEYLKI